MSEYNAGSPSADECYTDMDFDHEEEGSHDEEEADQQIGEVPRHSDTSDASGDEDTSQSGNAGKRPRSTQIDIDERYFISLCGLTGQDAWTLDELAAEFACSRSTIKRLKRKLGLTNAAAQIPEHVTLKWLSERWLQDDQEEPLHRMHVTTAVHTVAGQLGVTTRQLRKHMNKVGFDPRYPWPDVTVEACVRMILMCAWCCRVGVNFTETQLRVKYGMVVRTSQIRRVLGKIDPEGVRRRKKRTEKKKFQYDVKGPRSLYHLDAHEKLAKGWGIWIHGCIDGYSRYIVYLKVSTNKLAEVVRKIFLEGMAECGWASRCRWDRGKENLGAILEQVNHCWDPDDERTLRRGSAITVRASFFVCAATSGNDPDLPFFVSLLRARALTTVGLNTCGGTPTPTLSLHLFPIPSLSLHVCLSISFCLFFLY